jgi:hypothetical protein
MRCCAGWIGGDRVKAMRVDPDELVDAAQQVGQCAVDLSNSLTELQATMTSNNPWGGDEPGTLFGLAYIEILGHAMQVYGSHVEQLGEAAQGLADWAMSTAQTDQGIADRFTAIQARLAG